VSTDNDRLPFGAEDLRLPDAIRAPLIAHLEDLREKYLQRNWGHRVGFGERPALVVIDLVNYWLDTTTQMGSPLGSVVESTCRILQAARGSGIPIFFTTLAYDSADPPVLHDKRYKWDIGADPGDVFDLDPRLERRPTEKVIYKPYSSAFKATNFHEMLTSLRVDTLIVTGISTSHCVYTTCRDAMDSVNVVVAREAVGERCELMHRVNLLDIEIDMADVLSEAEVIRCIEGVAAG